MTERINQQSTNPLFIERYSRVPVAGPLYQVAKLREHVNEITPYMKDKFIYGVTSLDLNKDSEEKVRGILSKMNTSEISEPQMLEQLSNLFGSKKLGETQ